jgi:hypothetical protein
VTLDVEVSQDNLDKKDAQESLVPLVMMVTLEIQGPLDFHSRENKE